MFQEMTHKALERIIADSFGRSAGITISGASGSGKTETMQAIQVATCRQGYGLTYITPHEPDATRFRERMLAQAPSVRDRFVEIEPSNPKRRVKLQPSKLLSHPDRSVSAGQLATKVDHVSRILLTTSGESDFDGAPRKFAWIHRVVTETTRLGLPLSEAPHLIEPSSPIFTKLVSAVPNLRNRLAFEHLAGLSPTRQDELIEAVRNRFVRLFANELVEDMLSSTANTYDAGEAIQQRHIQLINLNPGRQALRNPEDVSLLANLFLAEIFHHVFCSGQTTPHFLFLDELPLYRASFPELIAVIPQIRKFQMPIVTASQGTFAFPDGSEDRMFNSLIAQCAVHIVMGHNHPYDCEFFAKLLGLGTYNPMREKHRLVQEQQYQDGHDLIHLKDYSYAERTQESEGGSTSVGITEGKSWSDSAGASTTQGRSQGHAQNNSNSRSEKPLSSNEYEHLTEAVGRAATNSFGENESSTVNHSSTKGGSTSRSEQHSSNWTTGIARQKSVSIKSQLVPVLRWRDVVSSVAYFTPEEQFLEIAGRISQLRPGEAFVRIAGQGTFFVQFTMARNILARIPNSRARAFADFDERLRRMEIFYDPQTVHEQRQQFIQNLSDELDRLALANCDQPVIVPQQQLPAPVSPKLLTATNGIHQGLSMRDRDGLIRTKTEDDPLL